MVQKEEKKPLLEDQLTVSSPQLQNQLDEEKLLVDSHFQGLKIVEELSSKQNPDVIRPKENGNL